MNLTKEAKEIIRALENNNFYVECPCCGEPILLKGAEAPLKNRGEIP
jgi:DNA-directed RNA polymerase subunit RPC12/RpoP